MTQMMQSLRYALTGKRTCWMKNGGGLSVCTSVITSRGGHVNARDVEREAVGVATQAGVQLMASWSFVNIDGQGNMTAVGIAELSGGNGSEQRLRSMGLAEIR